MTEPDHELRENLSVSIPASLREQVLKKAETERRPLSWVVEDLLRLALEVERQGPRA